MSAWVTLGVAVGAVAAAAAIHFNGVEVGLDRCEAAAAREERVAGIASDSAASAAAHAISSLKVNNVHTKAIVEREVVEVPVYRDCRHSPDGLRGVNAALAGTAVAEPPRRSELPASDAAR